MQTNGLPFKMLLIYLSTGYSVILRGYTVGKNTY
uniref:Poly(A) polymerase nucleotidyltransferase domain protein n=1 Tax=Firmicutes phage HS17 TaxID=3056395 RepID=A0AA49X383_9VIRU|nr:MAG: poly(A) polymerase nucleotidyltransferase domain protein [Firmicutes phage HS17]